MSIPPGAVPFADLTPALVARADDVHVLDEHEPGFGLSLSVTRARADGDTRRVLLVVADHDDRDLQVVLLRTMVLAAARSFARDQVLGE